MTETTTTKPWSDIPGTYVQDGEHYRKGYRLNMLLMTLNTEEGRRAFAADEAGSLDRAGVSPEQKQAVLERDWLAMLRLGANVYYLLKLAAYDRVSVQHMAGSMSGVTEQEFIDMMVSGGRSPEGNLYADDREGRA